MQRGISFAEIAPFIFLRGVLSWRSSNRRGSRRRKSDTAAVGNLSNRMKDDRRVAGIGIELTNGRRGMIAAAGRGRESKNNRGAVQI
jgi:hypothetical protein